MEKPYINNVNGPVLREGYNYLDAENYIHDQMDQAAEEKNWVYYMKLSEDLMELED